MIMNHKNRQSVDEKSRKRKVSERIAGDSSLCSESGYDRKLLKTVSEWL